MPLEFDPFFGGFITFDSGLTSDEVALHNYYTE